MKQMYNSDLVDYEFRYSDSGQIYSYYQTHEYNMIQDPYIQDIRYSYYPTQIYNMMPDPYIQYKGYPALYFLLYIDYTLK